MPTKTFSLLAVVALALMASAQLAIAQVPGGPVPYGPQAQGAQFAPQFAPQLAPQFAPQFAPGVHPQAFPPGVQPAAYHANAAVLGPSCGGKDNCKGCKSCCKGWCHCTAIWADFLFLRARDADVAYAVENNGPAGAPNANVPIQVARIGVVDQDHDPGFRFGMARVLDDCSSVGIQYSYFQTSRTDQTALTSGIIGSTIRSLVYHPSSFLANADATSAQATQDINFDLIDLDYRLLIAYCDDYKINLLAGVRYGNLEQQFFSQFAILGNETVVTDIDFDGVGPRFGLEAEWYTRNRRWLGYLRTYGSILAGEYRAHYRQGTNFDSSVVNTDWAAGRITTILDLELGLGWESECKTWRITLGHLFSSWNNVVKTDVWIDSVRSNNFVEIEDRMTFDGLVARLEARF